MNRYIPLQPTAHKASQRYAVLDGTVSDLAQKGCAGGLQNPVTCAEPVVDGVDNAPFSDASIAYRAMGGVASFKYFLIVLRDNPVSRLTDRILRPSRKTKRRTFAALSINITCSFSAPKYADVNKTGGSSLNANYPPKWVNFACLFTS